MRRGGPSRRRIAPLARSPKAGGAGARSRVRGLAPARVLRCQNSMKSILCHAIRHLLVFTSIPLFRAFSRSIRTFLPTVGVLGARIIRHPGRVPAMRFHPSAPDALAPSETPPRSPPRGKRGGFRRQPRSETATEPNRKTRTARRSENAVNLDELHENGAAASRQLRRKNFDFEPRKITQRKTARENFSVSATAVIFRSAGESGRV